jgi:hypothetical protein
MHQVYTAYNEAVSIWKLKSPVIMNGKGKDDKKPIND